VPIAVITSGKDVTLAVAAPKWKVVGGLVALDRAVRAFSGDDSLVLTTISLLTEIQSGLTVTDWRSGSAVWQYQGSEVLGSVLAQPGGRSFALALMVPTQAQSPLRDVVIVHADGTVTKDPWPLPDLVVKRVPT